jgi:hypothetical protein
LYDHCQVDNCDAGFVLGDHSDSFCLLNCSGRRCIYGLDNGICPSPMDDLSYSNILSSGSYLGANGSVAMSVVVDGGLWAYNTIMFALEKTQYIAIRDMHTEVTGSSFIVCGHTNAMYNHANAGGKIVLQNDNWWGSCATNICVNYGGWDLSATETFMTMAPVGIAGLFWHLDLDAGCLWGTTNVLPYPGISTAAFNQLPLHYSIHPATPEIWIKDGWGALWQPGDKLFEFDGQVTDSATNVTIWSAGSEFADYRDRSRISYIYNSGKNDVLSFKNVGVMLGQSFGADNVYLRLETNSVMPAPTTGYGTFVTSNYDLYWVTPTKTNLVVPGH